MLFIDYFITGTQMEKSHLLNKRAALRYDIRQPAGDQGECK
jgi:hypothetical protein